MTYKTQIFTVFLVLISSLSTGLQAQINLFETGQPAEVILGPYQPESNSWGTSYPQRVASDRTHLMVADTRNNRILIWNTPPTSNAQPADVVVGQPDFTSNQSSAGPSGLNNPFGVYTDGTKLFVADSYNARILIWNSIPTSNGQPADLVLGQPDFDTVNISPHVGDLRTFILDPWDVRYDGTKLYVVSAAVQVYIWNSLPTVNNQPADIVLGRKTWDLGVHSEPDNWNLSSPRSIATDGIRLAVSDYQLHRILIWNTIPTENGQPADIVLGQESFTSEEPTLEIGHGGLWIYEDKLFVAGGELFIWDTFPTVNNQSPDVRLNFTVSEAVCYDGSYLAVAQQWGSRVLIYDELPTSFNWNDPDPSPILVLGQRDFHLDEFLGPKGNGHTWGLASNGKKLIVGSDIPPRITIYNTNRIQTGAESEILLSFLDYYQMHVQYSFPQAYPMSGTTNIWTDGIRVFAASQGFGLMVWDRMPETDFTMPDRVLFPLGQYGSSELSTTFNVDIYGDTLFILEPENNRILMWNTIPPDGDGPEPDLVIPIDFEAFNLSTDGKRIAVSGSGGVRIWNEFPTEFDTEPDFTLIGSEPRFVDQATGVHVSNNHLFISESGRNRVCVYENFPTSGTDVFDCVLGQPDFESVRAGATDEMISWPRFLTFDGEYLWVAEHKFSHRVLGYKANIEPVAPNTPQNLTAVSLSSYAIQLNWSDNSTNEKGFTVKYKRSQDTEFKIYGHPVLNEQSCDIQCLEPATAYDFSLFAFNSYGESDSILINNVSTLSIDNHAPHIPSAPWPTNGEFENDCFAFEWKGGDPDFGDRVTYDLYFGTNSNPELLVSNISQSHFYQYDHALPSSLDYYWKVVARDLRGAESTSPVWSFRTCSGRDDTRVTIQSSEPGITNPKPGLWLYERYKLAYIAAIADEGYSFSFWEGDVPEDKKTDNPLSLLIDSPKVIKPIFTLQTYVSNDNLPSFYKLYNNYPNPFNMTTKIEYSIAESGRVQLIVYDILGRVVRILVDNKSTPGKYVVDWDGCCTNQTPVSSGLYFYKLKTRKYSKTIKMLLIK